MLGTHVQRYVSKGMFVLFQLKQFIIRFGVFFLFFPKKHMALISQTKVGELINKIKLKDGCLMTLTQIVGY